MPRREIAARVAEMLRLVKLEQFRRAQARPALRRPAPARRARPRARQAAEGAAARRAARRARQEAARGDAVRADRPAGEARPHLRHRHPRPGGGDDRRRPHRRHEPRPHRPGRAAGGDLRGAELALRRRLHRRGEHASSGVVERGGEERVRLDGAGRPDDRTPRTVPTSPSARTAWFAVRPEKVRIAHEPPADAARNAVPGEVWDIAYLGDMTLYNVRLASGTIVRASRLNAARSVERPITWEDRVWLSWAADAGVVPGAVSDRAWPIRQPADPRDQRDRDRWSSCDPVSLAASSSSSRRSCIVLKISLSQTAIAHAALRAGLRLARRRSATKLRELTIDNYLLADAGRALLARLSVERLDRRRLDRPDAARSAIRSPTAWRARRTASAPILVMLVILPFWTSFLIRVYAWIGILKPEGLLNQLLLWLGLIDQPLTILNTNTAVYIGIVYSYLPFMVLPLYASLEKLDHTLLEAAADLGSPPLRDLLADHLPALAAGRRRRLAAGLHPGGRRVRHPRSARRLGDADDRQDAVERVLPQPRLADGLRRRDRPAPRPGRADRALPERAGARAGARRDEALQPPSTSSRVDVRLRLPLPADPAARDLLVQRLAAGHGLGRLLDPLVRRAPAATRRCSTPPG